MNNTVKLMFSPLLRFFGIFFSIIPEKILALLFGGIFLIISRSGNPKRVLRKLFQIQDKLEWVINERATAYGNGVNPKHILTNYHNFFIARIPDHSRVVDIGCGNGVLSYDIVRSKKNCTVVGIDYNSSKVNFAKRHYKHENLCFIEADAINFSSNEEYNIVVLSNVLEHIEFRVDFLKSIVSKFKPEKILIRIPLFERDWKIPFRKELGVNYFSDPTHYIEHTLNEFSVELSQASLLQRETITLWGEIWSECYPIVKNGI